MTVGCKSIQWSTFETNLHFHVYAEKCGNVYKPLWTTGFHENCSQQEAVDCVEGFSEVNKQSEKLHVLINTSFLYLLERKDHVCSSPHCSKATLRPRGKVLCHT